MLEAGSAMPAMLDTETKSALGPDPRALSGRSAAERSPSNPGLSLYLPRHSFRAPGRSFLDIVKRAKEMSREASAQPSADSTHRQRERRLHRDARPQARMPG